MASEKDYESIAEVIRYNRKSFTNPTAMARFAAQMGSELQRRNPRFNIEKFMDACMPTWVKGTRVENRWERVKREIHNTDVALRRTPEMKQSAKEQWGPNA